MKTWRSHWKHLINLEKKTNRKYWHTHAIHIETMENYRCKKRKIHGKALKDMETRKSRNALPYCSHPLACSLTNSLFGSLVRPHARTLVHASQANEINILIGNTDQLDVPKHTRQYKAMSGNYWTIQGNTRQSN